MERVEQICIKWNFQKSFLKVCFIFLFLLSEGERAGNFKKSNIVLKSCTTVVALMLDNSDDIDRLIKVETFQSITNFDSSCDFFYLFGSFIRVEFVVSSNNLQILRIVKIFTRNTMSSSNDPVLLNKKIIFKSPADVSFPLMAS